MKINREDVDKLASVMGIDYPDIKQRKEYLEFNKDDRENLNKMGKMLHGFEEDIIENFYQYIFGFDELKQLVSMTSHLDKFRKIQKNYFSSLLEDPYDRNYVLSRLKIGLVHQKINVGVKWYLGAYRKYFSLVMEQLVNQSESDPKQLCQVLDSFLKVITFDMGLALETYEHANIQTVQKIKNSLDKLLQDVEGFIWEFDVINYQYIYISPYVENMLGYSP